MATRYSCNRVHSVEEGGILAESAEYLEGSTELPTGEKAENQLLTMQQVERIIIDHRPFLIKKLHLDDVFWAYLVNFQVIDDLEVRDIKFFPPSEQRYKILDIIKRGPIQSFHGFIHALQKTNQDHLIPMEVLDIVDWEERNFQTSGNQYNITDDIPQRNIELRVEDTESITANSKPLSSDCRRAITSHCEYNIKTLTKTHIFAFEGDRGDDFMDISGCLIEVEAELKPAVRNHLLPNKEQKRTICIPWRKTIEAVEGCDEPHRIRCYGVAGIGKTTYGNHLGYVLSKEFLEHTQDKDRFIKWNTVVVLKARDVTTSMEETIKDALGCKHADVQVMMEHVQHGEGVILVIDALDELRDKDKLKVIEKYLQDQQKKGGPLILITCRTDQCNFDARLFDRFITLTGFNEDQTLDYIQLYSKNFLTTQVQNNNKPALEDFVLSHKHKLQAIISNPLNCYLFCGLVMRKELDLQHQNFSIPNIFNKLEKLILKRRHKEFSVDEALPFYKLCLNALIKDEREFSADNLGSAGVEETYFEFLHRSDRRRSDGELEDIYSFSHEVFLEYFASRYIYHLRGEEQRHLLLMICADRKKRNVQQILFEMLTEEDHIQTELIELMTQFILILQPDLAFTDHKGPFKGLMALRDKIHKEIDRNDNLTQLPIILEIKEIQKLFQDRNETLRTSGWYGLISDYEDGTLNHVLSCLAFTKQKWSEAVQRCVRHILPDYSTGFVTIVGSQRLAEVQRPRPGEWTINCWSPRDGADLLQQYANAHFTGSSVNSLELNIGYEQGNLLFLDFMKGLYGNVWGVQDVWSKAGVENWTEDAWNKLLAQVAKIWVVGEELEICVQDSVQIRGLLSQLPLQTLGKHIMIQFGTADMGDVLCCAARCKQAGIDLSLYGTTTLLPQSAEGDESKIEKVRRPFLCKGDRVHINIGQEIQMTGLLKFLSQNSNSYVGFGQIIIEFGIANLNDALCCLAKFKEAGVSLELWDMDMVLTQNETTGDYRAVRTWELTNKISENGLYVRVDKDKKGLSHLLNELLQCPEYLMIFTEIVDDPRGIEAADLHETVQFALKFKQIEHLLRLRRKIAIPAELVENEEQLYEVITSLNSLTKHLLLDQPTFVVEDKLLQENNGGLSQLINSLKLISVGDCKWETERMKRYEESGTANLDEVIQQAYLFASCGIKLVLGHPKKWDFHSNGSPIIIIPDTLFEAEERLLTVITSLNNLQQHFILHGPSFVVTDKVVTHYSSQLNQLTDSLRSVTKGDSMWETDITQRWQESDSVDLQELVLHAAQCAQCGIRVKVPRCIRITISAKLLENEDTLNVVIASLSALTNLLALNSARFVVADRLMNEHSSSLRQLTKSLKCLTKDDVCWKTESMQTWNESCKVDLEELVLHAAQCAACGVKVTLWGPKTIIISADLVMDKKRLNKVLVSLTTLHQQLIIVEAHIAVADKLVSKYCKKLRQLTDLINPLTSSKSFRLKTERIQIWRESDRIGLHELLQYAEQCAQCGMVVALDWPKVAVPPELIQNSRKLDKLITSLKALDKRLVLECSTFLVPDRLVKQYSNQLRKLEPALKIVSDSGHCWFKTERGYNW